MQLGRIASFSAQYVSTTARDAIKRTLKLQTKSAWHIACYTGLKNELYSVYYCKAAGWCR